MSAGITKQVLDTKGTLKLVVKDVFFTQVIYGGIRYQNVNEHFIQRRDARVVNLSFSYRFGKQFKVAPKRNSGTDDEQNRVKAGG